MRAGTLVSKWINLCSTWSDGALSVLASFSFIVGLSKAQRLHFHVSLSRIGEGNGNPLQCSCLENPRDGGAWWAAISGVAQSQTRLKWLSSSSSMTNCFKKIVFSMPWIIFPLSFFDNPLLNTSFIYSSHYSFFFSSSWWSLNFLVSINFNTNLDFLPDVMAVCCFNLSLHHMFKVYTYIFKVSGLH